MKKNPNIVTKTLLPVGLAIGLGAAGLAGCATSKETIPPTPVEEPGDLPDEIPGSSGEDSGIEKDTQYQEYIEEVESFEGILHSFKVKIPLTADRESDEVRKLVSETGMNAGLMLEKGYATEIIEIVIFPPESPKGSLYIWVDSSSGKTYDRVSYPEDEEQGMGATGSDGNAQEGSAAEEKSIDVPYEYTQEAQYDGRLTNVNNGIATIDGVEYSVNDLPKGYFYGDVPNGSGNWIVAIMP